MRRCTSLRSACPTLLEMTMWQLCGIGAGRTFKVEVALEDIADQLVAATGPDHLHRVEIDHRRRTPIQVVLGQPVVDDEVGALENLPLDVLDPKLDACS